MPYSTEMHEDRTQLNVNGWMRAAVPRISGGLFPDQVQSRLQSYAEYMGLRPNSLVNSYLRIPFCYSLDVMAYLTRDYLQSARILSGAPFAEFAGTSRSFGYNYVHAGMELVPQHDPCPIRLAKPKRTTVHFIDKAASSAFPNADFRPVIKAINDPIHFSNHDPLHGANPQAEMYEAFDAEFRYGGVEYVPVALHAQFARDVLLKSGEVRKKLGADVSTFVTLLRQIPVAPAGPYDGYAARLYFCSILLRHLLLIFPERHQRIQEFLNLSQSVLFDSRETVVPADRFRRLLARDFSVGDEPDLVPPEHPMHTNRVRPYDHGRHSKILGPWMRAMYEPYVSAGAAPQIRPFKEVLLLDVLLRGSGIYAIASATEEMKKGSRAFKELTKPYADVRGL